MEIGNLDDFLNKHLNDELNHFIELNSEKRDFYGQEISDEVLAFIKENPKMLAPVREENKLYCMAFPCNMKEYLNATNEKMKRYHAKICNFREEWLRCSKQSFKITTIIIKYLHKPILLIFMRVLMQGIQEGKVSGPTMLLYKNDFVPYEEIDSPIICRKISTKKNFKLWIDVVNTALHGWDMIDAEHYFRWVESDTIMKNTPNWSEEI